MLLEQAQHSLYLRATVRIRIWLRWLRGNPPRVGYMEEFSPLFLSRFSRKKKRFCRVMLRFFFIFLKHSSKFFSSSSQLKIRLSWFSFFFCLIFLFLWILSNFLVSSCSTLYIGYYFKKNIIFKIHSVPHAFIFYLLFTVYVPKNIL